METINARLIIEIMGRPPEHVSQALQEIVKKLEGEKGVVIKGYTIHKPVPVKDAKQLFTSFAEVEVEFDSVGACFWICFAYMPSNIEIISPQSLKIANTDLNSLLGGLVDRLHRYDAVAKTLVAQRDALEKKLTERANFVEGKNIFIKEPKKPGKTKKSKKKR